MTLSRGLALGLRMGLTSNNLSSYDFQPARLGANTLQMSDSVAASDTGQSCTISLWFRPTAAIAPVGDFDFFTFGVDDGGLTNSVNLIYKANRVLEFTQSGSSIATQTMTSSVVLMPNNIYHFYAYLEVGFNAVAILNGKTFEDLGGDAGFSVTDNVPTELNNSSITGGTKFVPGQGVIPTLSLDIGDIWYGEGDVSRSKFVSGRSPQQLGPNGNGTINSIVPNIYLPFYSGGRTGTPTNEGNGISINSGADLLTEVDENWEYSIL